VALEWDEDLAPVIGAFPGHRNSGRLL